MLWVQMFCTTNWHLLVCVQDANSHYLLIHSARAYECQPVLSSSLDSGDTVVSKAIDFSIVSFKQGQLVWKPQEAVEGKMSHIGQFRSVSPRR